MLNTNSIIHRYLRSENCIATKTIDINIVLSITVADKLQKLNETLRIVNIVDLYKIYFKNGKHVRIHFTLIARMRITRTTRSQTIIVFLHCSTKNTIKKKKKSRIIN